MRFDLFYALQYSSNMIICEIVWTPYRNPHLFSWNLEARTEAAKGSASLLECILLHQPCKHEKMVCCGRKNQKNQKMLEDFGPNSPEATDYICRAWKSINSAICASEQADQTHKMIKRSLDRSCWSVWPLRLLQLLPYSTKIRVYVLKQDAAHEPDCSHVEHFCETNYLNSPVHVSTVTVPVHCKPGMRNRVECKAWRVECKTVECRVWSVESGV